MGIQINGQTDTITGISGNITVGTDLTVPGVLTYDDVTNVDSVGLITARDGITVKGNPAEVRIQHTGNSSYSRLISDSNNQLNIYTGGGPNLAMTIDQNQSIGIGRNNPEEILHVQKDNANPFNTPVTLLKLQNGGGNQNSSTRLELKTGSATCYVENKIRGANSGSGADLVFATPSSATVGSERVRITSDGRVGIGTDNPDQAVEINGTTKFTRGSSTEGAQMLMLPCEDITLASTASASIPVGARFTGLIIVAGYSNDTPGGVWAVASASAYDVDAVTRLQFKNHPVSNVSDLTITSPSVGGTHQFQLNQTGTSTKTYKVFAMGIYG